MARPLIGWKPLGNTMRAPSARIRCLDPLRYLRREGYPVELYTPRHHGRYAAVVLQKLYDPDHLALASALKARGVKVVFDLCDNHLDHDPADAAKAHAAGCVRRMLDLADVVTTSSATLAERLPAPSIVIRDGIAPPSAWARAYGSLVARRARPFIEIVWYGVATASHQKTGLHDLRRALPLLESLSREYPLRLTVMSSSRRMYRELIRPARLRSRYLAWGGYERFCARFPYYDLCLIPVSVNPLTVCKTNNRLALSLYLGVPVVADAIPSYREFAPYCVLDDWDAGLRRYLDDHGKRRADAAAGRNHVLAHHMLSHSAGEWRGLFDTLAGDTVRVAQPVAG